jgi:hypothetical protein
MYDTPSRRMKSPRALVVPCLLLPFVLAASTVAAVPTSEIVNQIDQSMYQHYLDDLLYTHPGDNRGFGPEHDLARQNIFDTFVSFGLDVSLDPFPYDLETYYNVVAIKEGQLSPGTQFIIGAHYDSVNNPGADDNGSGTAGVMEIARVLSQYEFESTIIFIAFDREEQGLIGSNAYATEHAADNIQGMISLDMIAYNTGADAVDIYGRAQSNDVKGALAQAVLDYGQWLSVTTYGSFDASDHAPFEWQGFQACLIIEDWGNPNYHTPQDHVEMPNYIDYPFATQVTRSVCGWLVDQAALVDTCPCDCALPPDGVVNVSDFLQLLGQWGGPGSCECAPISNGVVDVNDFLYMLSFWGPCP